jgi:hypothetical protein
MENGDIIQEMAAIITEPESLQNDIVEITKVIGEMINEKYIQKMNLVIQEHAEKVDANPPKAGVLLQAMKPFIRNEAQPNLDRMIALMNMMRVANSLQSAISSAKPQSGKHTQSAQILTDTQKATRKQSPLR